MIIRSILNFLILIFIAELIVSQMPFFEKANWRIKLKKITDFFCNPIKKFVPIYGNIDFSPLIAIGIINLIFFLW